ncbi:plasmid stabilization system protein [Desulfosporosinus acididurans]|uniref:Plasmid stabilization system protein n=1 Tax=Desulfosporosinus acididurans TaxID=476652 RepID=A0A0J1FSC1_9FIRM|nr:type II toxin-antitoxin system RelE/ParE family toxin [Desulfosporosinus acididurans]KLU66390.1 plasmid stabilization system protein [Desulfosporosinus acididurans]
MNKLLYSVEALNDLDRIWVYINNELQNPAAAKKIVLEILDTIEKLRNFAELGPPLSSIIEFESDYRFLVCGKYIAFYRVTGIEVHIDRVLYGRRNYLCVLFYTLKNDDDAE